MRNRLCRLVHFGHENFESSIKQTVGYIKYGAQWMMWPSNINIKQKNYQYLIAFKVKRLDDIIQRESVGEKKTRTLEKVEVDKEGVR